MSNEIKKIARAYADRIRSAAVSNKTSAIAELYRLDRDLVRKGIDSRIINSIWIEIVNDRSFRSDRADWVLF